MNQKIDKAITISEKLVKREEHHDVIVQMNVKLNEMANNLSAQLTALGSNDQKCTELDQVIADDSKERKCTEIDVLIHEEIEKKNIENAATPLANSENTFGAEKWAAELEAAAKSQNKEPECALCPESQTELEHSNLSLEPETSMLVELESAQHPESVGATGVELSPQNKIGQHKDTETASMADWEALP